MRVIIKMINEFRILLSAKLLWILGLLAIFFSTMAGYYYYQEMPLLESIMQNIFSTIKLFMFSPDITFINASKIIDSNPDSVLTLLIYYGYIISIFSAPICTATAVLYAAFYAGINLLHKVNLLKKSVYVFGFNDDSKIFINNIISSNDKNVVLIVRKPIEKSEMMSLLKKQVYVYEFDYKSLNDADIKWNIRRLKIRFAEALILFEENALDNYELLTNLIGAFEDSTDTKALIDNRKTIPCCIHCDNNSIKNLISIYYEDKIQNVAKQQYFSKVNLDVKIFNIQEIAARDMFNKVPLYMHLFDMNQTKNNYYSLNSGIGMLIVGFGKYGNKVLEQTLLLGSISRGNMIKIYVIDKNASMLFKKFSRKFSDKVVDIDKENNLINSRRDFNDGGFEIKFLEADACEIEFVEEIKAIQKLTCATICLEDPHICIECAIALRKEYSSIPISMRLDLNDKITEYISKNNKAFKNMFAYGNNKEILTYENVVQLELDKNAVRRHFIYQNAENTIIREIKFSEHFSEGWLKLSIPKRESNRYSSYVDNVRKFIILINYNKSLAKKFHGALNDDELHSRCKEAFSNFIITYINDDDKAVELMEELCAIEHKRWFISQCLNGYSPGNKDDNIYIKTNPSMVDWGGIKEKERHVIKYDRYNVILSLYQDLDESIIIEALDKQLPFET